VLEDVIEQTRKQLSKGLTEGARQAFEVTNNSGLEKDLENGMSQAYLKGIQSSSEKIKEEQRSLFAETLKDGGSIYDALGLNLDDGQQEAIKGAMSFIKGQLGNLFNFRKQIADQNVNLANAEVAEAQRTLDAQIENRNAGFAHSVQTAQKELEEAKKNQKKALKEQEKAQRAQLAIQSIQEAQNLIQASSKIFAQFGNPFISIPLIGAMFAFFAASKIKAFQLAKKRFGKGGYAKLEGGSHASGNDIALGFEVDGKQAYGEGGEDVAIFNRGAVRKYGDVLPNLVNAINRGKLEEQILRMGNAASDLVLIPNGGSSDNSRMEKYLRKLVKQGETQRGTEGGKSVVVQGNLKTIYV
jgi:ElaB/YqjD/DUF883 family membrane-anchored ribosome-binding protein